MTRAARRRARAHAALDARGPQPRSTSVAAAARRAGERIHDVLKEQIVERAVEERERSPLAGAASAAPSVSFCPART